MHHAITAHPRWVDSASVLALAETALRPAIQSLMPGRRARALAAALGVLALLAASPTAQAQYKWKDAAGQVHLSDLPPPREIPAKDIMLRPVPAPVAGGGSVRAQAVTPASGNLPTPAVSAAGGAASANSNTTTSANAAPARNPLDPELEERRKRSEAEAKARARADEDRASAVRAENCQRARQQLALVNSGQRMQRLNDRGERVVVDDAGRADEAQLAQRVIASDCR